MGSVTQGMGAGKSMRYLLSLLFFLLFVPPLLAQDSYHDFERGLQLSSEQRMKMEEIKGKYMNEWQSSRREIIQKKLELQELNRNSSQNLEKIEKLHNEIMGIKMTREDIYTQYRGDVSRVLNNEQKEKYNNFCNSERRRMMRPPGIRGHGR